MAKLNRRDFIKKAVIGTAAVAGARVLAACGGITKAVEVPVTAPEKGQVPVAAPAKGKIMVNSDICAGCLTCNIVCSLYNEGVVSKELSRIHVLKDELGGYLCEPVPCLQCDGPECLYACPVGAIYVDDVTGARVIDPKPCIGCKLCIEACPATPKRIQFNTEKKVAVKCDLCGGEPQCVKFCPLGALTYEKTKYA